MTELSGEPARAEGGMDPAGRSQTESGRTGGIVGVVLSLLFAAFFALMYLRAF